MDPIREQQLLLTRRHFFGRAATGIGTAALASLVNPRLFAGQPEGGWEVFCDSEPQSIGHGAPGAVPPIMLFDELSTKIPTLLLFMKLPST